MVEPSAGLVGSSGRLGTAIRAVCAERGMPVVLEATSSGIVRRADPDVVICAAHREALDTAAGLCRDTGAALVLCASGLLPEDLVQVRELSRAVPVVVAPNLALGHWLQLRVVRSIAELAAKAAPPPQATVDERHPVTKAHRPSTTAEVLAEAWQEHAGFAATEVVSLRTGLPVSEHALRVTFAGESLAVHHDVRDLRAAANGALLAARWATTAPSGLHPMSAVYDHMFGVDER
ncbi:dihydrodipicolinate reductase C-terminal domain-containing protein [Lentzea sp. NPDC006480]|uniref:dihydrodipicolinate reductase C-terminal domain-containing protein n=1 Tax=Lentzea sp. NPDC006480 TaxID=3157176 RepID=UPI0033A2F160